MIHNKPKWDNKLKEQFSLPENAKIAYFRNPKEFKQFNLERINPSHVGLLRGNLKKKYRTKAEHSIIAGRIKIPLLLFLNSIGDKFIFLMEKYILTRNIVEMTFNLTMAFCLMLFMCQLAINGVFIYRVRIY